MKKITLIVSIFFISMQSFSQAPDWLWAKAIGDTSGGVVGYSAAVDASGNIYTTGNFSGTVDFDPGAGVFNLTSAGSTDIFISKLDASGNFIWAKQAGGTDWDNGQSIGLDASNNVYTTGFFSLTADFDPGAGTFNLSATGINDIFILKLDNLGNFVWAKAIGGSGSDSDVGWYIALDTAGSGAVYTTGFFEGTADFDPGPGIFNLASAGFNDTFISKLDSSGNFMWAKRIGGTSDDVGMCIALDQAGSGAVYTTGAFNGTADFDPGAGVFNLTSAGSEDIYISKLDASGNFVWAKTIGGTYDDAGRAIAIDASGNVYNTGSFYYTVDFDPGAGVFNLTSNGWQDIYILKLDSSGNFIWAKSMGDLYGDFSLSIALDLTGSGDVYTAGTFPGTIDFDPGPGIFNLASAGNADIFISKLDNLGNFVWAKAMGGTLNDRGQSIVLDISGNVHLAGYFYSPSVSFGSATLINANSSGTVPVVFIAKLDTITIVTGEDEIENFDDEIILFPNPATSELVVRSSEFPARPAGGGDIETIEIYSSIGEKVFTQPQTTNHKLQTVNVSQLLPGIYFIIITDQAGNKVTKKIVKM